MNYNVISPKTTKDLFRTIKEYQSGRFRIGAGCTDLLIELKKQPDPGLTIINLVSMKDDLFISIKENDDCIRIGALVNAHTIATDTLILENFPVLTEAASKLASSQIRHVATLGGNVCTASPAGDMACALVALEAECEIVAAGGNVRIMPIESFFTGVRKTDLKRDEVLRSIFIPFSANNKKIYSGFIKIGTRRSMECAVVSLAYHIRTDSTGLITTAGIAVGSVAPKIMYVTSACDFLVGRNLKSFTAAESGEFASYVQSYADPISDIRASAWYREEVLFNISKSLFEN